jgi:hypothetical protein
MLLKLMLMPRGSRRLSSKCRQQIHHQQCNPATSLAAAVQDDKPSWQSVQANRSKATSKQTCEQFRGHAVEVDADAEGQPPPVLKLPPMNQPPTMQQAR